MPLMQQDVTVTFDEQFGFISLVVLAVVVMLYALPAILAWKRESPRKGMITAINLLLGWTVIGWIVAMVMTLSDEPQSEGDESELE